MSTEKITTKKKWQNLAAGLCPVCGAKLVSLGKKERDYKCSEAQCSFLISKAKLLGILTDPDHVLRRFMEPAQVKEINELADALREEERDTEKAFAEYDAKA